jgi:hypothetical protein
VNRVTFQKRGWGRAGECHRRLKIRAKPPE